MAKVRVYYREDRKKRPWGTSYRLPGEIRKDENGNPKYHEKKVYKFFKTKSEAYTYKEFMEYQLNHEGWQGVKGLTWQAATDQYLSSKKHHISNATLQDVRNTFAAFASLVAPLRSDFIRQGDIQTFITERKKGCNRDGDYRIKPKNSTINKDLRNLRAFYRWCVESGYAKGGVKFIPLPTISKAFIPPTREQLQAMFAKAKKQHFPLYVRMVIALTTGLRRAAVERLHLNESHKDYIDIERRMLVTTEKRRDRVVKHLGDNAMKAIFQQISDLPVGSDKLLIDKWGNDCRRVFEKIRIKGINFHSLRSIAVSILGDMGESPAVLQQKLGHTSFKTTANHYVAVSAKTDERTTKLLDDFVTATGR